MTSRGSKLIGLSLTFHHSWILDSFQMGDTTCYSYSQSCFGPGLGEIRNIKWSILIGGSATEKGGTTSFGVQCSMRGAVCQCVCSSLEDSWGGLDGITIDYTFHHNTSLQCMPCWLVWLLHFWKEGLTIHFVQCLSHHKCVQRFLSFVQQ